MDCEQRALDSIRFDSIRCGMSTVGPTSRLAGGVVRVPTRWQTLARAWVAGSAVQHHVDFSPARVCSPRSAIRLPHPGGMGTFWCQFLEMPELARGESATLQRSSIVCVPSLCIQFVGYCPCRSQCCWVCTSRWMVVVFKI